MLLGEGKGDMSLPSRLSKNKLLFSRKIIDGISHHIFLRLINLDGKPD